MTALEIVYVASFFFGLIYAIASTIMGGGHSGGGFDASHDIAGHIDAAGAQDSGTIHFSPLSPVVIAMFVTAFGATGMICLKALAMSPYMSLPVAVLAGLAVAALTFAIFVILFRSTQASSEPSILSMVGGEAEVITPIPAEGVGEIAYVSKGARYTASARSSVQTDIKAHTVVRVDKIVGSTFYVKPSEQKNA